MSEPSHPQSVAPFAPAQETGERRAAELETAELETGALERVALETAALDTAALETAEPFIGAPLAHRGKVRELYDLGDRLLIVVTDRISAFDFVLRPAIPNKGRVLSSLASYWFARTRHIVPNHVAAADPDVLERVGAERPELVGRTMLARRAQRIDVECVVRGWLAGGGWRQYERTGRVNGISLPSGLRRNDALPAPIFTPAVKNDVGHDEDITFSEMEERVGATVAARLRDLSLALYGFARDACAARGILLADTKLEFGWIDDEIHAIDEMFTPDCSRFWSEDAWAPDVDIDSMDKEPVRTYLARSGWDRSAPPEPLPDRVVLETTHRYEIILHRLTGRRLEEWS